MSDSRRAVLAAMTLLLGVVAGWAVWQVAYPYLEPVALARLGAAGGALALWGLLGPCLAAGFLVAFRVGRRWIGLRPTS